MHAMARIRCSWDIKVAICYGGLVASSTKSYLVGPRSWLKRRFLSTFPDSPTLAKFSSPILCTTSGSVLEELLGNDAKIRLQKKSG